MNRVNVSIIGANGYSGEELCALLARHPGVNLISLTSRQLAGQEVTDALPRLTGLEKLAGMRFQPSVVSAADDAEFVFLALPHGLAAEFAVPLVNAGKRVIDLSADFRLRSASVYEEFYGAPHPAVEWLDQAVYGLPELHREAIRNASLVASAGCYPTSILLPLIPLLRGGLIDPASLIASCASGVSGAGRKADAAYLFAECNESMRAYGVPKHRHLSEIEQELSIAADSPVRITFVPHLAPLTRGIHSTLFATPTADFDSIQSALHSAYQAEPFVRIRNRPPEIKDVVGTNFCDIFAAIDQRANRLIVLSAEDNLVKGAAGQAVQNFNLMAGYPESTALI